MNSYMLTDPDFGFNSEDSVTFKVEINVYGDLEVTKDSIMTNKIHTMTQCMQKLLNDPIQPDVSLVIGTDDLFADGITINDWALKFDEKHFTIKSITGSSC